MEGKVAGSAASCATVNLASVTSGPPAPPARATASAELVVPKSIATRRLTRPTSVSRATMDHDGAHRGAQLAPRAWGDARAGPPLAPGPGRGHGLPRRP